MKKIACLSLLALLATPAWAQSYTAELSTVISAQDNILMLNDGYDPQKSIGVPMQTSVTLRFEQDMRDPQATTGSAKEIEYVRRAQWDDAQKKYLGHEKLKAQVGSLFSIKLSRLADGQLDVFVDATRSQMEVSDKQETIEFEGKNYPLEPLIAQRGIKTFLRMQPNTTVRLGSVLSRSLPVDGKPPQAVYCTFFLTLSDDASAKKPQEKPRLDPNRAPVYPQGARPLPTADTQQERLTP